MNRPGAERYCSDCGTRLARDNSATRCAPCTKRRPDHTSGPPNVPADFWTCDLMRDALATWHIGKIIRAYRHHPHHGRVLSQERVATWLGLDQTQLSRVENGPSVTDLAKLTAWARTLSIPSNALWFKVPGRSTQAPASPSVGLVGVAELRARIQQLDERYVRVPSTSLLAEAGECLGQVGTYKSKANRGRARRDLLAAETEAAILMGQLVWDASQRRDHATANAYFDQAIDAAQQLRDPRAEGQALLRKSYVALYGEHDPQIGLMLTGKAAKTTRGISDVLTGLALSHAAEAYAMLGRRQACERSLSTAESAFAKVTGEDDAIELYSPTQLGRLAGSCYLHLRDPRRAEPILAETAAAMDDGSKSQAVAQGNLALAHIRQRRLDEATGALHRAIDLVQLNWGGGGLNIAFGAGRELCPWRDVPAVQDVDDRLLTLIAAP